MTKAQYNDNIIIINVYYSMTKLQNNMEQVLRELIMEKQFHNHNFSLYQVTSFNIHKIEDVYICVCVYIFS